MCTIYPDYYPRFSCIASRCTHNCCIGWEIDIDPDTLRRYQAEEGPMGQRLARSISAGEDPHFLLGEGERCPFLNQENLCDLILYKGEGFLCQICTDHPRFRTFLPNRAEVGLGLCCEEAARLILSQEKPVTLCGEAAGEPEPDAQALLDLREQLFALAQDRSQPIKNREQAILARCQTSLPDLTAAQWAEIYLNLERLDPAWTAILEDLRDHGEEADPVAFNRFMTGRETEYEQLLVYFLYRHFLTAYEDGDPGGKAAFAVLSTRLLRRLGARRWQRTGQFSLEDQAEYARLYSSEVEYSQENLDALFDLLMG